MFFPQNYFKISSISSEEEVEERQTRIESAEIEKRILPKRVRPSIDIEDLRAQAAAEAEAVSETNQVDTHFITQELEHRRVEHSLRVLDRVQIVEDFWKKRIEAFRKTSVNLATLHSQSDRFQEGRPIGTVREQEALSIAIEALTQEYQNLASQLDSRFNFTFNSGP